MRRRAHRLPARERNRVGRPSTTYRPYRSGRRATYRPGIYHPRANWPWRLLAVGLCLVALVLAGTMIVRARSEACQAPAATIIWADQVTAEEGNAPIPPMDLVGRAQALASCSGGELELIQAAGQGSVQASPPVALRAYREPGELEHDPFARARDIQHLVDGAFRRAWGARVPGAGRDLIGLLAGISADLGPGRTDVWLRTFGLPTQAPADVRILMAADPAQAATSVARWVPKLPGARVHLILSPPTSDQPRLNTATDAWRRAFMLALLREAGATVVSIQEVQAVEQAAPGAPPAPPVANLAETTPHPPTPKPGKPYQVKLDTSALFRPNSTKFVTSEQQVLANLRPLIKAWQTGGYIRVVVVGHCAKFGPSEGALALSRQRAQVIASLLRQGGVTHVTAIGVGYNQPLPPNPYSTSNRVVIVTAYPKA